MRAAAEFELGLKLYERADYSAAAQAFLRADALIPSEDALKNGIAAARKASDHLAVARASRRAIARESTSSALAATAREALAQAAPHLGRLELSCEPAPCQIRVDDADVESGEEWVLPGTRRAVATHGESRAEQDLVVQPGATYRVVLRVGKVSTTQRVPVKATPTKPALRRTAETAGPERPWSPVLFYVGVAATLVLSAATVWSGVDTLKARDALPADPTTSEVDSVRARIRRTDLLLGGTLVVAAGTGGAGLWLVDWRGRDGPGATGFGLVASGRF